MSKAPNPADPLSGPVRPHHHGNLRQALITASIQLLDAEGPSGLTLRKAAAKAGVSHAAPAHHFAGLPDLLTAVATEAFALFTEAMRGARQSAGDDPMARLEGICRGYIRFANDHAGLFHVMFLAGDVDRSNPTFLSTSETAYAELRLACLPFSRQAPDPDQQLEIAVWSLVHGYAVLGFGACDPKGFTPTPRPDFNGLLRRLVLPAGAAD